MCHQLSVIIKEREEMLLQEQYLCSKSARKLTISSVSLAVVTTRFVRQDLQVLQVPTDIQGTKEKKEPQGKSAHEALRVRWGLQVQPTLVWESSE